MCGSDVTSSLSRAYCLLALPPPELLSAWTVHRNNKISLLTSLLPFFCLNPPFHLTQGWIEGVAILIAVLIVALVTASNDYSKELQFRALEKSSEEEDRAMVLRDGEISMVR